MRFKLRILEERLQHCQSINSDKVNDLSTLAERERLQQLNKQLSEDRERIEEALRKKLAENFRLKGTLESLTNENNRIQYEQKDLVETMSKLRQDLVDAHNNRDHIREEARNMVEELRSALADALRQQGEKMSSNNVADQQTRTNAEPLDLAKPAIPSSTQAYTQQETRAVPPESAPVPSSVSGEIPRAPSVPPPPFMIGDLANGPEKASAKQRPGEPAADVRTAQQNSKEDRRPFFVYLKNVQPAFDNVFPYGYDLMKTSAQDLLCGFYGIRLSISAQIGQQFVPSMEDLKTLFQRHVVGTSSNLSDEEISQVIYAWGRTYNEYVQLGVLKNGSSPYILRTNSIVGVNYRTLWLHNDNAASALEAMGRRGFGMVLNHWEGMQPRPKPVSDTNRTAQQVDTNMPAQNKSHQIRYGASPNQEPGVNKMEMSCKSGQNTEPYDTYMQDQKNQVNREFGTSFNQGPQRDASEASSGVVEMEDQNNERVENPSSPSNLFNPGVLWSSFHSPNWNAVDSESMSIDDQHPGVVSTKPLPTQPAADLSSDGSTEEKNKPKQTSSVVRDTSPSSKPSPIPIEDLLLHPHSTHRLNLPPALGSNTSIDTQAATEKHAPMDKFTAPGEPMTGVVEGVTERVSRSTSSDGEV